MASLYFDYNSTTPVDPQVLEKMLPFFKEQYGNASSLQHQWGWAADTAVKKARKQVANLIGAEPHEVIFTSGATESNNWSVFGVIDQIRSEDPHAPIHLITNPLEHSSVKNSFLYAQKFRNVELDFIPVDSYGMIQMDRLKSLIKPHTKLISVMWVNNEIGTVYPIQEIAELCSSQKIYFHSDATQALGKMDVNMKSSPVDLLSFSGHKIYAPKGVGALYIRSQNPRVSLSPLMTGGGQEKGLRSGTLNVPAIVGLGEACELAQKHMSTEIPRLKELQGLLWSELQKNFSGIRLNGHPTLRAPNNLNVTFAQKLPPEMSHIAVSRTSACMSGAATASPTLLHLGLSEEEAHNTLRISLGRWTTPEDVKNLILELKKALKT